MAVVSMKQLLEAGVHFGHQTRRWNPKMAPYIYMERNGIYIIDLQKTVKKLEEAYSFVRDTAANGGTILFVGTKKQAQDAVKEEAERVGMYFVNARWLGGMLTNFKTMRTRIDRLQQLRKMQEDGTFDMLPKKEVIKLTGEIAKLEKYLGGVQEMRHPGKASPCGDRPPRGGPGGQRRLGRRRGAAGGTPGRGGGQPHSRTESPGGPGSIRRRQAPGMGGLRVSPADDRV